MHTRRVLLCLFALLLTITGAGLPALTQDAATPPPTPYRLPTLPPSPTPVCASGVENRLIVHERGRVTNEDPSPLNLRTGPHTDYEIIGELPTGELFFVLEGPRCSPRYAWYRVRYGELEGWIAEGSDSVYFVEPYFPG